MKKMIKSLAVLLAAIALTATASFSAQMGAFEIKDVADAPFKSEMLKGKTAVVVIAQTACTQCRKEIADLAAQKDQFKDKAELYVVLVDVNGARAKAFFEKQNYGLTLLFDPDFTVGDAFNVAATPSTIIVADGEVKYIKTGYRKGDIDKLLAELDKK